MIEVQHLHPIANLCVHQACAAVDFAAFSDGGSAFDRDARVQNRVRANRHLGIDVSRRRILDRDAGGHEALILRLSHDATHCRELDAAVDALDFFRMSHRLGFHSPPICSINRDQVRQVVFALRIA